jgi:hypothetical protein
MPNTDTTLAERISRDLLPFIQNPAQYVAGEVGKMKIPPARILANYRGLRTEQLALNTPWGLTACGIPLQSQRHLPARKQFNTC